MVVTRKEGLTCSAFTVLQARTARDWRSIRALGVIIVDVL